MIGRRLGPIFHTIESGRFDLLDATLSVLISGFLLLGVLGLRRILFQAYDNQLLLETLTQFDHLTKSLSRTEILYQISKEIDRSRRSKHCFALLEMDIDHFKNVNDRYGHHIGDEVLVSLVKHSKETLRSIDMIGRIGGEEFLVLLPETSVDGATQLAERLRENIANMANETSSPTPIKITISVGITIFDPHKNSIVERGILLNELINRADIAMYQAKNGGRNRVALWSTSDPHLRGA